jgi:hypothetical protein
MKNLVKKGIAYSSLAVALLFNPLKTQAQALYFHVGDMLNKQNYTEIGSSLAGINISLEDLSNHQVIAELRTDENGNARYNFTSVKEPNFNFNKNNISSVRIFDLQGRLEETHYGNNFEESRGKPSGIRFYEIEDVFGNKYSLKSLNLEGEIRNGIIIPNAVEKYSKRGRASTDDISNVRLVISDPNQDYFQFIDTLNINDNEVHQLNLDLFPNVEVEYSPDVRDEDKPYRNFLDFLKKILRSSDDDFDIGEGRRFHYRWPRFPIDIFHNYEDAPNENYRNAIRDFERDVSNIRYGDYSHRFVNLVDAVPDSGSRYDFSQEGSWQRVFGRRIINDGDTSYVVVNGEIYVNNTYENDRVKVPTYHESLNQLVIGRDSANPLDIQHAGGPIPFRLSNNDKHLLVSVKNIPPNYRKLMNHREIGE